MKGKSKRSWKLLIVIMLMYSEIQCKNWWTWLNFFLEEVSFSKAILHHYLLFVSIVFLFLFVQAGIRQNKNSSNRWEYIRFYQHTNIHTKQGWFQGSMDVSTGLLLIYSIQLLLEEKGISTFPAMKYCRQLEWSWKMFKTFILMPLSHLIQIKGPYMVSH